MFAVESGERVREVLHFAADDFHVVSPRQVKCQSCLRGQTFEILRRDLPSAPASLAMLAVNEVYSLPGAMPAAVRMVTRAVRHRSKSPGGFLLRSPGFSRR